jgi:hypothetical protein
MTHHA